MLAHVHTAAIRGVDSFRVQVEVNLATGLPAFTVVGLPHGAVREGRERVAAALRNSGFELPPRRITVNLAPADVRKEGTAFDLPIALGILAAAGCVDRDRLEGKAFLGELGLDGSLRPVSGVLPIAAECASARVDTLVVPEANAREASLVGDLRVLSARSLRDVTEHLNGGPGLPHVQFDPGDLLERPGRDGLDLRDVRAFQVNFTGEAQ